MIRCSCCQGAKFKQIYQSWLNTFQLTVFLKKQLLACSRGGILSKVNFTLSRGEAAFLKSQYLMKQCYLRYLLNAFQLLRCFNGHFRNAEERNCSFCSLAPYQTATLCPFPPGRKKKKIKRAAYPTQKFGTRSVFSQWCFSAGLKPRSGFKLQTAK